MNNYKRTTHTDEAREHLVRTFDESRVQPPYWSSFTMSIIETILNDEKKPDAYKVARSKAYIEALKQLRKVGVRINQ